MANPHIPPSDRKVEQVAATAAAPAATPPTQSTNPPRRPRGPPLYQVYKQPAPLRVFPLPPFAGTSNPASLFHLVVAWLSQVIFPPASEPSVVHTAFWDHETRTIVVTDPKSMEDLWQQGFYGKGSLSRSEPNWLKKENARLGATRDRVSEMNTDKRREDRARAKWERARAEQEAIEQKRLDEAKALAVAEAKALAVAKAVLEKQPPAVRPPKLVLAPVGPLELLALPNSYHDLTTSHHTPHSGVQEASTDDTDASLDNGSHSSKNDASDSNTTVESESTACKRRKSVRFSPKVESTVFEQTDPPSPSCHVLSSPLKFDSAPQADGQAAAGAKSNEARKTQRTTAEPVVPTDIVVVNKEHLQLTPEEAFFLTFALGALKVKNSSTQNVFSPQDLLLLLRQNSYFPPRLSQQLQPDDSFLLHYAVYHHFRSLGWVPRSGIKFGVDCKCS